MLSITLAQLKSDITPMMKGTSLRQVVDFYGTAFQAASRMLARIDPQETKRTALISTPFMDNLNDYSFADDYKRMVDIRPQANRQDMPGLSHFSQTSTRQFLERLDSNSFSIRWNNAIRTLRAQRLPAGNVTMMDPFDSSTSNGTWSVLDDASGLYSEPLNYIEGNGSLGFNLSGVTGFAEIQNSTAAVADLSAYNNEDYSMLFVYIPVGKSSRFTSFYLLRGTDGSNNTYVTVTTKADGTAFTDGWNLLLFSWSNGLTTGTPDNEHNTFRQFGVEYSIGTAISGVLVDNWTNSFGQLYEMEYYSEYMFRTAAGAWIARPTDDSDLVNVGPASYEILKNEMMIDITKIIRTGRVRSEQLEDLRLMLNGQSASRWIKDPYYKGLYADYLTKFPSDAIVEITRTYDFDV